MFGQAYLNPNGLKYHLEKGTCKFAGDEDDITQDTPKRSRPASPSTSDNAYHAQQGVLDTIPKIEERSLVNTMINDTDPLQEGVSQPFSQANAVIGPSSNAHHSVAMNPTWGTPHIEKQCPHPYTYPVDPTTAQHFKREEQTEYPLSPPPPQPRPRSLLGQSVPQYMAQLSQQIQFHYPVPTYPNGYTYAQQHRPYFASERATYEPPMSLLTSGVVAPSSSQWTRHFRFFFFLFPSTPRWWHSFLSFPSHCGILFRAFCCRLLQSFNPPLMQRMSQNRDATTIDKK